MSSGGFTIQLKWPINSGDVRLFLRVDTGSRQTGLQTLPTPIQASPTFLLFPPLTQLRPQTTEQSPDETRQSLHVFPVKTASHMLTFPNFQVFTDEISSASKILVTEAGHVMLHPSAGLFNIKVRRSRCPRATYLWPV